MDKTGGFGRQVGISTLALADMPLAQATRCALEGGFRVFELVPRLYGGPERFDKHRRRRLREEFACFERVTVHTSGPTLPDDRRANIASPDVSCRRQSVELYLAHVRLALDVGAEVVTLHPGFTEGEASPFLVQEANLAFARSAIEEVGNEGLQLGYEYFDLDLTREIGHPRFGLLFDVGHAALRLETDITAGILNWMEKLFPHIVQFHVHGVRLLEGGLKQDHLPLQANNALGYAEVIREIKRQCFAGPVVLEIENSDKHENLRNSILGREALLAMWGSQGESDLDHGTGNTGDRGQRR
jgi:sugar phosphate isomerase/epimerase